MAQRNTFRDDEDLEEKINMRDLARVGVYLKPYMARVVWILIVVAAMGCINVVEPYLTKIMIDSVIPAKNLALLGELVALLAVHRHLRIRFALPYCGNHARRPAHA